MKAEEYDVFIKCQKYYFRVYSTFKIHRATGSDAFRSDVAGSKKRIQQRWRLPAAKR